MPKFDGSPYTELADVSRADIQGVIKDASEAQPENQTKFAAYENILKSGPWASKVRSVTASGVVTLADGDPIFIEIDPDGSDRDVNFPAKDDDNHGYIVLHSGSANTLTLKRSGGATITTLAAGEAKYIMPSALNDFNALAGGGGEGSSVIEQNSQSAAYTTVLSDAGKHILHPASDNNARTFTIDSNANVPYPIGTPITFVNEINTLTIAITSDTMVQVGSGATGSFTLAPNEKAYALKVGATKWLIMADRKRPLSVTVTQHATPTYNTDAGDLFVMTGLAQAITSLTTNKSGAPRDWQWMAMYFKDDGTARAITPGGDFVGTSNNSLTGLTTAPNKWLYLLWQYNPILTKWVLMARDGDA